MQAIANIWRNAASSARDFGADSRALAATEFAVMVPLMLVLFFGTIEVSSGVAIDRKVTIMARTLSDLTSQSTSVGDTDMTNFFAASYGIMTPYYNSTVTSATISEPLRRSHDQGGARAMEQGILGAVAGLGGDHPLDARDRRHLCDFQRGQLRLHADDRLRAHEPITLSDVAYSRPRQSTCVYYSSSTSCTTY